MKSRTKIFLIWLGVFIISVVLDVIYDPAWRSFLYFVLNFVELVSMFACIIYFPGKKHE